MMRGGWWLECLTGSFTKGSGPVAAPLPVATKAQISNLSPNQTSMNPPQRWFHPPVSSM